MDSFRSLEFEKKKQESEFSSQISTLQRKADQYESIEAEMDKSILRIGKSDALSLLPTK